MRKVLLLLASAMLLLSGETNPVVLSWFVNPAARTAAPALRAVLPNVQNVRQDERFVYVESAGLSLQSLGSLEAGEREAPTGPRHFEFRLPLLPHPARSNSRTPLGVTGVLLTGVPVYNPVSAVSWQDQNLWHLDAVAAAARSRASESPLLSALLNTSSSVKADSHPPLLGYALDGFPIYGPAGLRSSYRLRDIKTRNVLPDGTELTPAQEGPPVNAEYPLGSFAEDYEYVAGTGDLDQHNGRFTVSPEYPHGTYAYFLATTPQNQPAYPYLIGETYYGEIPAEAAKARATVVEPLDPESRGRVQLEVTSTALRLLIRDAEGGAIRFLEKVHEKPVHLAIVSDDLKDFAHIHPELQPDDTYLVQYSFPHGGVFWLYADHTAPGEPQRVSRFRLDVPGSSALPASPEALPLNVRLTLPDKVTTGSDLRLRFDLSDARTGLPVNDLEPYLGAWAHLMIVSADHQDFIHAHPLEDSGTVRNNNPWQHSHAAPGPSPSAVETITGFRQPGVYRMWAQFQRNGAVITVPWTLRVEAGPKASAKTPVPGDAIEVRVGSAGFSPSRITVPAGKPLRLAFLRADAQNCAGTVVFPELGIERSLPPGETVIVEIPASPARELHFACGMKMFRGTLLVR